MSLSGFKELEAALGELKDKATARKVADRALRKAAEPIRDRAKELAPDDPETGTGNYLVASIQIGRAGTQTQRRGNSGSLVTTYIGINGAVLPPKPSTRRLTKKGTGKPGGGVAQYSIFTELGTLSRPAHPFMRPAWEEKQQEALANLADILRSEILKTKARAARKAAR